MGGVDDGHSGRDRCWGSPPAVDVCGMWLQVSRKKYARRVWLEPLKAVVAGSVARLGIGIGGLTAVTHYRFVLPLTSVLELELRIFRLFVVVAPACG